MAGKKNNGNMWVSVALFAVLTAAVVVWGTITPEYLMESLQSEREFSMRMGGAGADQWIYTQAIAESTGVIKDAASIFKGTESLPGPVRRWAQERVIVTWLWASLVTYRAYMLLLYFLVLFPFVIAITIDGWGVREISTHRFSFQSPIRHRMGVIVLSASLAFVVIWLLLPTPIPAVFAPLAIIAMGVANWIWLGNLQKRI